MKLTLSILSIVVVTFFVFTNTLADIARPKPTPSDEGKMVLHTGLTIVPDASIEDAQLRIRKSDLKEFRAAIDDAMGNTTMAATIARSSNRTIIAGVMLFLSLSLGGVWLVRSARTGSIGRGQKMIAVVLIAVATLGAAAIITRGNAGPPPSYRWRNLPQALTKGDATRGTVNVVIVSDDKNSDGITLFIPLKKAATTGEE